MTDATDANQARIDTLNRRAAAIEDSVRQIETQYGTGVRPGWVSEELSMLWRQHSRCREEADQLAASLSLHSTQDNNA